MKRMGNQQQTTKKKSKKKKNKNKEFFFQLMILGLKFIWFEPTQSQRSWYRQGLDLFPQQSQRSCVLLHRDKGLEKKKQ